jgi:putative toxin-antitoxin system antitoxin component (TIGR02293 family)
MKKDKEYDGSEVPAQNEGSIRIMSGGKTLSVIPFDNDSAYFLSKKRPDRSKAPALSFQDIEPIIEFFEYKQQDLAQFLDVNPSTVSRWRSNDSEIGSLRSKNIFEVDRIVSKGVRIFGSEKNFKEWLSTVNYALGDVRPVDILKDPYGVDMVDGALEALSWGNYI